MRSLWLNESERFAIAPSTSTSGVAEADLAIQYGATPGSGSDARIAAPAPSWPRLCCFSKSSESFVPPKSPDAHRRTQGGLRKTTIATAHSCFISSDISNLDGIPRPERDMGCRYPQKLRFSRGTTCRDTSGAASGCPRPSSPENRPSCEAPASPPESPRCRNLRAPRQAAGGRS